MKVRFWKYTEVRVHEVSMLIVNNHLFIFCFNFADIECSASRPAPDRRKSKLCSVEGDRAIHGIN